MTSGLLKEIDGRLCVSSSFLAEAYGVTVKTLLEWEKKGCPKAMRGYWNLADVIKWKEGQAADVEKHPEKMTLVQKKIYWDAECKKAQAEAQQFKNAVVRGEYLEKNQMQRELYTFFTMFKQAVLALPRRAAILCAQYIGNEKARQIENVLAGEVRHAVNQWSKGVFNPGLDSGGDESVKTPGENDGQ